MRIVAALILFGFLVLFHELGHFTAARACGVRVLEFSVGMGPKLFSIRPGETVYSIRLLPIGGFCSMLGEDQEGTEALEGSFQSKSAWQRFLVILMGPLFNFLLAFFLALFVIGNAGVDRPVLTGVEAGYPASEAGIRAGDTILRVNGKHIDFMRELTETLYTHPGEPVSLTVRHAAEGETRTVLLTPRYEESSGRYLVGIQYSSSGTPAGGAGALVYYAAQEVRWTIESTVSGLLMMLRGALSPDDLTGPVGIVSIIGDTVQETEQYGMLVLLLNLADLALLISANLGVMNLLPLPALDGGRLVFCLIEILFRRPVNRNVEGYIHFAGFVLLMVLMVFLVFHDIGRIAGV